jgi:hypothetical protein
MMQTSSNLKAIFRSMAVGIKLATGSAKVNHGFFDKFCCHMRNYRVPHPLDNLRSILSAAAAHSCGGKPINQREKSGFNRYLAVLAVETVDNSTSAPSGLPLEWLQRLRLNSSVALSLRQSREVGVARGASLLILNKSSFFGLRPMAS